MGNTISPKVTEDHPWIITTESYIQNLYQSIHSCFLGGEGNKEQEKSEKGGVNVKKINKWKRKRSFVVAE